MRARVPLDVRAAGLVAPDWRDMDAANALRGRSVAVALGTSSKGKPEVKRWASPAAMEPGIR